MTDINYANLMKRAEDAARECMESSDSIDGAFDLAAEYCDWNWVIYYGMAMELCQSVPGEVLNNAEFMASDCAMVNIDTTLYEHAAAVAFCIVHNAVFSSLEYLATQTVEA